VGDFQPTPPKYDNPPGRLHAILTDAKKMQDGDTCQAVWQRVLLVEPGAGSAILVGKLMGVFDLYVRSRELVASIDHDAEVLGECFPNIEKALLASMNLSNQWGSAKGPLNDGTLYALRTCSYMLAQRGYQAKLPKEDLDTIREQIQRLVTKIMKAEQLDVDFREFLLKHLRMLENAIIDYRLRGVEGIVESLERALGEMALRPDVRANMQATEAGESLWTILSRVSSVVSIVSNTLKIGGYCVAALPMIGDFAAARLLPHNGTYTSGYEPKPPALPSPR
jgi:hypothetical protein